MWQSALGALARYLVVDQNLDTADVVVILSGDVDRSRLAAGLALVTEGRARWVVVLTGPPQTSYDDLATLRSHAESRGVDAEHVIVVGDVHSTIEDARRAAQVMKQHTWRTAMVVTSPYHTRRAAFTFRQVWGPLGLSASVRPSRDLVFGPGRWSQHQRIAGDVVLEYVKLAVYAVRFALSR